MFPTFLALIAVPLLFVIYETVQRMFFLPVFGMLLLVFWIFVGNPVMLLTSVGSLIMLTVMVGAARILSITLHAVVNAAKYKRIQL